MRRYLALLVVPLAAAIGCGEIKTVADDDGGAGESDAAPSADAGNPGDPLNGAWQWWIGDVPENPDSTCDVTIGGGAFEVYCPSDPFVAGTDCMQTKNDTRIQGTWSSSFAGTFDQIERFEGTGCAAAGHPDVDVDIVTEGLLVMEADHAQAASPTGFLPEANGQWDWAMWEADDTANRFECAVSFEPGADDDVAAFRVECLEAPVEPVPDCTEIGATVIQGTIGATQMTGEGWGETRYEGAGCDPMFPDPVVEEDHTPMGATHE